MELETNAIALHKLLINSLQTTLANFIYTSLQAREFQLVCREIILGVHENLLNIRE